MQIFLLQKLQYKMHFIDVGMKSIIFLLAGFSSGDLGPFAESPKLRPLWQGGRKKGG